MDTIVQFFQIFHYLEIIEKMYKERKRTRQGGYVSEESDDAYEKEVIGKEEEEERKKRRKVAAVIGIPQPHDSYSSDSDVFA